MGNKYSKEDTKKFIEKYGIIDGYIVDELKEIPLIDKKEWLPIPVELTESQYKKWMKNWEKKMLNQTLTEKPVIKKHDKILSRAEENLIISVKYTKKKLIEEEEFLDDLYSEAKYNE